MLTDKDLTEVMRGLTVYNGMIEKFTGKPDRRLITVVTALGDVIAYLKNHHEAHILVTREEFVIDETPDILKAPWRWSARCSPKE